jgi:thioredoxin reductase
MTSVVDVAVVGAGPAGVGMGIVLDYLGVERFIILERHEVGASFRRWPAEMRLITPSFPSNGFGMLDLNSIALQTSPAFSLGTEHPTGIEYASYLQAVAAHFELPVMTGVDVTSVLAIQGKKLLTLDTSQGELKAKTVIWATGEYQYPFRSPFPGAEHCRHSSDIRAWSKRKGERFVVIGGYESGIDAAVHLSRLGKQVTVIDGGEPWENGHPDPSISLSPFTRDRLDDEFEHGRIIFVGNTAVAAVSAHDLGYVVEAEDGRRWEIETKPILATGFLGGTSLVRSHFAWDERHGTPLLTEHDESTVTPGLFLIGPQVRHGTVSFCFIYKFRQRLPVVAKAIGERLRLDVTPLENFRAGGMLLDDLSCCVDDCLC